MRTMAAFLALGILWASPAASAERQEPHPKAGEWRGLHLISYNTDKDLQALAQQVPALASLGLNVLILEINYAFDFRSHPELRQGKDPITAAGAAKFAAVCKTHGIRLIPEFQSLGHQSWAARTFPLLTVYPQFDLTPGAFPANKGIYCREWDPTNPAVNKVVLPLMDEILDGFGADALHVGMDEVFLIGSPKSPATKDKDPAQVMARAIKDLHEHLVGERKVEMLMWADRLFDADKYHWDEWEASKVGTAPALDMIPKDIILCPWHYHRKIDYPSIPLFLGKGFRVLPASWKSVDASQALIEFSTKQKSDKMLGHLFTTWSRRQGNLAEYPPLVQGLKQLKPSMH